MDDIAELQRANEVLRQIEEERFRRLLVEVMPVAVPERVTPA